MPADLLLTRNSTTRVAFRVKCDLLTLVKADPIVDCGQFPSMHAHNVFGSERFSPIVTQDQLTGPALTSCSFAEDKSMYW